MESVDVMYCKHKSLDLGLGTYNTVIFQLTNLVGEKEVLLWSSVSFTSENLSIFLLPEIIKVNQT